VTLLPRIERNWDVKRNAAHSVDLRETRKVGGWMRACCVCGLQGATLGSQSGTAPFAGVASPEVGSARPLAKLDLDDLSDTWRR
jgi:hypothetical protein